MNKKTEIIMLPGTYNIWDKRHQWQRGKWEKSNFTKFHDNGSPSPNRWKHLTDNYKYDLRLWDFNHENHGFWNKRTVIRGWGVDPTDD